MAIVLSTAIGNAVKTAGELTYRRTKGRTIASRRIITNKSKTDPQKIQRSAFAILTAGSKALSSFINASFSATKYGTPRNNFIKSNKAFMDIVKKNTASLKGTNLAMLADAVQFGNLQCGDGNNLITQVFTMGAADAGLSVKIDSNVELKEGDKIQLAFIRSCSTTNNGLTLYFATPVFKEYVVKAADIAANVKSLTIDKTKLPALATIVEFADNQSDEVVTGVAALLREKETCTCFMNKVPLITGGAGGDEKPGGL